MLIWLNPPLSQFDWQLIDPSWWRYGDLQLALPWYRYAYNSTFGRGSQPDLLFFFFVFFFSSLPTPVAGCLTPLPPSGSCSL